MLGNYFVYPTESIYVRTFVKACIHCLSTTGGDSIPPSFGPALHGTDRNDLDQFGYIDMGKSGSGDKYVLMVRADMSDYKWFFPFPDTAAENVAREKIEWTAAFGAPKGLISGGPLILLMRRWDFYQKC